MSLILKQKATININIDDNIVYDEDWGQYYTTHNGTIYMSTDLAT